VADPPCPAEPGLRGPWAAYDPAKLLDPWAAHDPAKLNYAGCESASESASESESESASASASAGGHGKTPAGRAGDDSLLGSASGRTVEAEHQTKRGLPKQLSAGHPRKWWAVSARESRRQPNVDPVRCLVGAGQPSPG
jgi:hypothetical protein